ncbi:meiotic recombination protein SPO11 isoform X3 [Lepisosteus oculatus]|uniref:meiotic recombination protein SPO11 isoform X3 n=1 Tax=Lepisosteus oculatus TaxID=7918 RepID=UPI0007401570|nr:PREDICTED: meiotic recombination protein SPO11 isoform X5 [Lepisosteus oculatus]
MSEQFIEVDRLRALLVQNHGPSDSLLRDGDEEFTSEIVLARIENVIEAILTSLSKSEAPTLTVLNRSCWSNIRFEDDIGLHAASDYTVSTIRSDCSRSVTRFATTLKVLSVIYKMVQSNSYATKRDIYYNDTQLFGSQRTVDLIVDDISCMLRVPRRNLHVLASSKGFIAGDLCYTEEDGTKVNCDSGSMVCETAGRQSWFLPMFVGKGVPDVNSRLMVRRLWDSLCIPIFALVDADPHGIEIMCIYKYGSVSMSFDAHNLTVPAVMWLGLLPSDIERLNVPKDALIPFTKRDHSKLQSLQKRPYFNSQPLWKKEIELMLKWQQKAEIQCLTSIAPDYLTRVYLPNKLRFGGWI